MAVRLSYWDLAQELNSLDETICWCQGKSLLATQTDCVCGCCCRIVKQINYPGKQKVTNAHLKIMLICRESSLEMP